MKAPEGMKWIDVTYTARRAGQEGEACMQILIDEDTAASLVRIFLRLNPLAHDSLASLDRVLRAREKLYNGEYVYGSIKDIRIMEDDDD